MNTGKNRFACTRPHLLLLLLVVALPTAVDARAPATTAPDAAGTPSYALLVASHRPGLGQRELLFSAEDARRMQTVLTELGGYAPAQVELLLDPDTRQLQQALSAVAARLAEHARRGEPTVFLYYYSGHARAQALNLGHEEVPLAELKRQLEQLPATLRLVVLDACQSGAISGVKGAEPAAEFSASSVAGLSTTGMAVLASSSGSELSQESERLGGSFFTHHLVAGLRGAADSDADGQVTLSEAHRYAYHHTLVSTAATTIGKQHVTLETDLRGKGETVLSRPARGGARLELPAPLLAEVLVHRQPGQTVMAELHKVAGEPLQLALPPGSYSAIVRRDDRIEQCELQLPPGGTVALLLSACRELPPEEVAAKGLPQPEQPRERWALELAGGLLFERAPDSYAARLADFGFSERWALFDDPVPLLAVSVVYGIRPYLSLLLGYAGLDREEYLRELRRLDREPMEQSFSWSAHRLGLYLRGSLPLLGGWLVPYAEAGGGPALGFTTLGASPGEPEDRETFWGWHVAGAAGLQLMPWRRFGFFAQGEWVWAPVIENLLGDEHDSGGPGLRLGLRGSY